MAEGESQLPSNQQSRGEAPSRSSPVRRWARVLLAIALAATVLLNNITYKHARAMLYFTPAGEKTARPEDLGLSEKLRVLIAGVDMPHGSLCETDPVLWREPVVAFFESCTRPR